MIFRQVDPFIDYRCDGPHPRQRGKRCNYLIRIALHGYGAIECPRCRTPIFFGEPALTGTTA